MNYLDRINNILLRAFQDSDGPFLVVESGREISPILLTKYEILVLATEDYVSNLQLAQPRSERRWTKRTTKERRKL